MCNMNVCARVCVGDQLSVEDVLATRTVTLAGTDDAHWACLRSTPASRNPRIGLTFIFLNTGVITTKAPRNLRKSRPKPFSSGSKPERHSSCRPEGERTLLSGLRCQLRPRSTLPVTNADAVLRSARHCGTARACTWLPAAEAQARQRVALQRMSMCGSYAGGSMARWTPPGLDGLVPSSTSTSTKHSRYRLPAGSKLTSARNRTRRGTAGHCSFVSARAEALFSILDLQDLP